MNKYSVLDFGAVGDGKTSCTDAIQRGIDQIRSDGGGELYFPAGDYLCGTLILCSNLTLSSDRAVLHLEPGTEPLRHIPLPEGNLYGVYRHQYLAYPLDQYNYGFLCAAGEHDICIDGLVLEADDRSYCEKRKTAPINAKPHVIQTPGCFFCDPYTYFPVLPRPQMLLFMRCTQITLRNLEIYRSPCFSAWLLECNHICCTQILIRNTKDQYNADGFHFSSCHDVSMTECDFVCGDDCIAVDAESGSDASDICVKNCVFETSMHALRLYTGLDFDPEITGRRTASVHDLSFSDLRINGCCAVSCINAWNGDIHDIQFRNIDACQDIPGTGILMTAKDGEISSVDFSNIQITGDGALYAYAEPRGMIHGITLSEVSFRITPYLKMWGVAEVCELSNHALGKPYNLVFRGCRDIRLRQSQIHFETPCFSSSFSAEERENIVRAVGEEYLSKIEPETLPPVSVSDCEAISFDGFTVS